jgi:hypothetical protein
MDERLPQISKPITDLHLLWSQPIELRARMLASTMGTPVIPVDYSDET